MQGFAPADETLLFRQKCPKPFPPVCGPYGVPPPHPKAGNCKKQKSRGTVNGNWECQRLLLVSFCHFDEREKSVVRPHSRFLALLEMTKRMRWARLGRRPESTSRRRLFEWRGGFAPRSEFLSHLIRGGGPGTPENLLLSKVGGVAHRQKWFWFLLPKQKGLVAWGRNPTLIFPNHTRKNL